MHTLLFITDLNHIIMYFISYNNNKMYTILLFRCYKERNLSIFLSLISSEYKENINSPWERMKKRNRTEKYQKE